MSGYRTVRKNPHQINLWLFIYLFFFYNSDDGSLMLYGNEVIGSLHICPWGSMFFYLLFAFTITRRVALLLLCVLVNVKQMVKTGDKATRSMSLTHVYAVKLY